MNINNLQNIINQYDYWDSRVSKVECNYFSDEVQIAYENGNGKMITYSFVGCYRVFFEHNKDYEKNINVKAMSMPQIPYFMQDVKLEEKYEGSVRFIVCNINMYPLQIEIWSKELIVEET
jgi:hypothetical protein